MERHKRELLIDALTAVAVAGITLLVMWSLQTPFAQAAAVTAIVAIVTFGIRFAMRTRKNRKSNGSSGA